MINNLNIVKNKLINRYNGILCDNQYLFHAGISGFIQYIEETPVLKFIIDQAKNNNVMIKEDADNAFNLNSSGLYQSTIESQAAYSYFIIEKILSEKESDTFISIAQKHSIYDSSFIDILTKFMELFIKPIYILLVEGLADENLILFLLLRFKQKCEWFKKQELYDTWVNDTKKGEKNLAWNLYEYLFDNGIDFSIEPTSKEGDVDLITSQIGPDRLIADAKIFKGDKKYIINSLNQISTYTSTYNQRIGYLVIFKVCEENLLFNDLSSEQNIQYFDYNNKVFYFLIIDIYKYDKSASKRGQISNIEIKKEEFVQVIENY